MMLDTVLVSILLIVFGLLTALFENNKPNPDHVVIAWCGCFLILGTIVLAAFAVYLSYKFDNMVQ